MAITAIRIDAYSATNTLLGTFASGGISNWATRLSAKGQITVTIPALELAEQNVSVDSISYFRITHNQLADLGIFYLNTVNYNATNKSFIFNCDDQIVALENDDIGANVVYRDKKISEILASIASKTGWTIYTDLLDDSPLSLIYESESYLQAIDVIRKWVGGYFVLMNPSTVMFGQLPELTNVFTRYGDAIYGTSKYFADTDTINETADGYIYQFSSASLRPPLAGLIYITNVVETTNPNKVVNRIIPNGAGVFPILDPSKTKIGEGLLHLGYSTKAPVKLSTDGTAVTSDIIWNADKKQYYLEDKQSISAYGLRTRTLPFLDIRPITNEAADVLMASNTLYDVTLHTLKQNATLKPKYQISCKNLPSTFRPGLIVYFEYKGTVTTRFGTQTFRQIGGLFYIINITVDFDAAGTPTFVLDIAQDASPEGTITNVISNALEDINTIKVRPLPSLSMYLDVSGNSPITAEYIDPVNPSNNRPQITKTFTFNFDNSVSAVNELKAQIIISRLRSFSYGSDENGALNVSASDQSDTDYIIQPTPQEDKITEWATGREDISHGHFSQVYGAPNFITQFKYMASLPSGNWLTKRTDSDRGNALFDWFWDLASYGLQIGFLYVDTSDPSQSGSEGYWRWRLLRQRNYQSMNSYGLLESYADYGPNNLRNHQHRYIQAANGHAVSLPNHAHKLLWGVLSAPATTQARTITADLNGTNLTLVQRAEDNENEEIYEANLTPILNLEPYFRSTNWRLTVKCGEGMGDVVVKIKGRVTLQPIQVV